MIQPSNFYTKRKHITCVLSAPNHSVQCLAPCNKLRLLPKLKIAVEIMLISNSVSHEKKKNSVDSDSKRGIRRSQLEFYE